MSDLPFTIGEPQAARTVVGSPKRCVHPRPFRRALESGDTMCTRCGADVLAAASRKGRTSRNYGNRAELQASRTYGGVKVGHAQGPVDIRGVDFDTQMKTHRRPSPGEWVKAINAMTDGTRIPRLLVRFVQSGHAPDDWFVFRAKDFLDWFGKDE